MTTHKEKNKKKQVRSRATSLSTGLERSGLSEYVTYLQSPRRIWTVNMLAGISRGFGFVIGATIVVTLVTVAVSYLTGIPIIGQFFLWIQDTIGAGRLGNY